MNQALKDLLERAIALEGKADADLFGDGVEPAEFDADGFGPEEKSWSACSSCGSTNVDAYADGTAACEDCGMGLTEAKDFDDLDDGVDLDLEEKADMMPCPKCHSTKVKSMGDGAVKVCASCGTMLKEKKSFDGDEGDAWLNEPEPGGVLSEFELLRAQRASSGI